jgi:YD repeat-containing protein
MKPCFAAALAASLLVSTLAETSTSPPVLQFTSGLPGQQVHLEWPSAAGLRYRIEKSSNLSDDWKPVAIVDATGATAEWTDPEPTSTRAFYRVTQPETQVSSISPPILSTSGGTLYLHGQCIPAGSVLVLEVEGQAPLSFALTDLSGGVWQADITGTFLSGARVLAARIEDAGALTLLTLDQPLEVTTTGRATDLPPSLTPAVPAIESARDKVRQNFQLGRLATEDFITEDFVSVGGGPDDDCDGPYDDDDFSVSGNAAAAGLQTNPTFQNNKQQGTKPDTSSGFFTANPSSLPGEVSLQSSALSLPCPAGPPLDWVCTYRSLVPTNSGHGPGWDFSYNVSIEPVPAADGASAARLLLHDGAGHTDTLHRQADGTYRCDGMFREGAFSGNTFTLTFADQGTWTFKPLSTVSPDSGKIAASTDRNGVALAFAYNPDGTLASVSDAFGRSLTVEWDVAGARILSVSSGSGGAIYLKTAFSYSGSSSSLESLSCPFVPGQPPVCGPVTFTYDSAALDPRLADNLLSFTDGAGRSNTFGYSATTTATAIDYDVCTSSHTYGSAASPPFTSTFELLSNGNYLVIQCDEVGRVTESVCDPLHRVLSIRQYTGFSTPGTAVTSSSNRPTGKLRAADPDFFETTCVFNSQHLPTRITRPDGSQDRVTYACDLDPACAVRERANARVLTIATSGGETRTVTCDFLPNFGTPEAARPGNPIRGLVIKFPSPPRMVRSPRSNYLDDDDDGDSIPTMAALGGILRRTHFQDQLSGDYADSISAHRKEEGGRHTPFHNTSLPQASEKERGITINTSHVEYATSRKGSGTPPHIGDDYDQDCDNIVAFLSKKGYDYYQMQSHLAARGGLGSVATSAGSLIRSESELGDIRITRLTTSLGQTTTWTYDVNGNRTSETSPVPGRGALYEYNARGQCTAVTILNGAASSFRDECTYDAVSGFLSTVVCDSSGLQLTTSVLRDDQGRITSVTDPRGFDTLYAYNPLHQCVQVSSPPTPNRIVTTLTIDAGGFPIRCDTDHRAPDGTLDSANPAYSSYYFYDTVGQLTRVAHEDRPSTAFDELAIGDFAVCDYTYDDAGQVIRVSIPAACRAQATDLATAFTYDERGLLHRMLEGDTGNPGATGIVTTECDYTPAGQLSRCATLDGITDPQTLYTYDGFHRLSSVTDPMGNVATYAHANNGAVTCSVYGETIDLPGSADNLLLATTTFFPVSNPSAKPSASTVGRWSRVKNKATLEVRLVSPFFCLEVEDDTVTTARFSPGGPSVLETTIIDRSPAGLVQSVTLNGDLQLACTYDSAGRLATCSDGACTTALTRDANGNVLSATRTDLTTVAGAANKTFTTACLYDALNRCVQATDGTGNVASLSYDSLDRPVELIEPGGLVVTTEYDGASTTGQPFSSRTIVPDVDNDGIPDVVESSLVRSGELVSTTDSYGHSTSHTRDSLGRVTRCDFADGTFAETTYDVLGRLGSQLHQDGTVCTSEYDLNSRVTGTSWTSPPTIPAADPTIYQYDGLGRCVSAAQGASLVTCTYDSTGNQLTETQDGHTITRTFNHLGRSKITYPDGKSFDETRDALGQLLSISALDVGGAPISPPVVALQYAGHRVLRSTQANGVVTTHTYRADGESALPGAPDASFDACVRTTVSNASSTVLTDTLHRRDPNQRETACETLFSSAVDAAGRTKTFTRDALGRVTACLTERREVTGGPIIPASDVAYTLDLEGRRLTATGGDNPGSYVQDPTFPPGDQQMGQYTVWPGGPLQWDDSGNLALFSNGASGQLSFVHDAEGRLLAVNDPNTGSAVVTYTYDALGRRINRSTDAGAGLPPATTRFIYDGGECIQELDDDGTGAISAALTFVSSGGIKHCISTRAGTIIYPHGGAPASSERAPTVVLGFACTAGSGASLNLKGVRLKKVIDGDNRVFTITNSTGNVIERLDCDDAGKPIFLDPAGLPTTATESITGLRWLSPACAWEPEIGMFACPGSLYSPALGIAVSEEKPKPKPDLGHGMKKAQLSGSLRANVGKQNT